MNLKDESILEKVREITELPRQMAIYINDALKLAGYEPFVGCSAVSALVIVEELQTSSGAKTVMDDEAILAPYIFGDETNTTNQIVRGVALWRKM